MPCIVNCFQAAQEQDSIRIVTRDSDLMVYEGIPSMIMPIGKDHSLTTFSKEDLLGKLDLPSEKHLVLAGKTSNDYVQNIKHLGLVLKLQDSNLEPIGAVERNTVRSASFGSFIGEYLRRANASTDVNSSRYSHAITAFIERIETPIQGPEQPAAMYPAAHDALKEIFNTLLSSAPSRNKLCSSTAPPANAPDPLIDLNWSASAEPDSAVVPVPGPQGGNRQKGHRSQKELKYRRARMITFNAKKEK
ncbi:unnamed protein product [Mortierella alpina]